MMTKSTSIFKKIATFTIALVLVFAALSTATYAWYSTTNTVKAGDITFTSSVADGGGALTIGKTTTSNSSELTFDTTQRISPMIPANKGVIGVTDLATFKQFQTTYEECESLGYPIAAIAGVDTEPYNPTVDGQLYFYLNNRSESDITVAVDYEITGALAAKLNVAIFTAPASGGNFTFRGVMTNSSDVHYGRINIESKVEDTPTMNEAIVEPLTMSFVVPANDSLTLRLFVWLDGVNTKNEDGNKETSFSLAFLA